ncbi:MAG TPA: DnaA/Hda family protein, partial [Gammaproteobacteria bacterium]|nr:DnaA/Hda family protein [Gammaproteobacteria bacterium]
GRLLVTAHVAPAALRLGLADLRTRLGWGLVFHLRPLDDEGKLAALRLRAERRGFELPEETARYLLSRFQRDMRTLCGLLEALDTASLAAQRRLTIPFVKSVLPPA